MSSSVCEQPLASLIVVVLLHGQNFEIRGWINLWNTHRRTGITIHGTQTILMYVYIFVLVVDSTPEMIKLVGIVVHNFNALTRYIFRFYFRHITVITTGLTDQCKNVERKCINIANAASSVIVDPPKYRKWIYFQCVVW